MARVSPSVRRVVVRYRPVITMVPEVCIHMVKAQVDWVDHLKVMSTQIEDSINVRIDMLRKGGGFAGGRRGGGEG